MLQPLARRLRARGRLAACGLGLVVVLALGGPLGVSATHPGHEALRVSLLDDGLEQVLADGVGHRFDRRPIRDPTIGADGTVRALLGRRVVELGRSGRLYRLDEEPRA